ncbi:hypothetical protein LTR84_011777 [Exophiala bonariae]|uniref:NACHT domain-containing protein n=1 Tax=Exophiala bonariae TaxID=1690606 RepID=A0AAV9NHC8_9EURO|nr:hypothetical protein LTR84_011777 [Exophiala bonariae]
MVLEPLSAFSVACNVLQIIEVGTRVLKTAAEYRSAADGATAEHAELRNIAQSLLILNADLQATVAASNSTQTKIQDKAEAVLISANDQCLKLSTEFIKLLDRLKVDGTKHAMLEALRLSVRSLWYKDRLDSINKSLSQARDNLNLSFLIYMNSRQATSAGQSEITRSTTEVQTKILEAVSVASNTIQDDIQLLADKLEYLSIDSFHENASQFLSAHQVALNDLAASLNTIMLQQYDLQSLSAQRQTLIAQQKIIDSLHFPLMNDRRDHVQIAHQDTCEWIFAKQRGPSPHTWSNFPTWLSSENETASIYWVHGKPGSGKSTLMRWLDQNLTDTQLGAGADNGSMLRARHFFWNSGTTLQKSLAGFLRSICAQMFEQAPEHIPEVVQTKRWTTALLVGYDSSSMEWTEMELIDTLKSVISTASKSAKILLLIDGLDEIDDGREGNLERLIDLLLALAKHPMVKICVSSRPWNIFRDIFGACAQLRLEDFTQKDIVHYVQERLQSHPRFQFIIRRDSEGATQLVQDISRKSSGVFLWVRLVVEELRAGLRDGDNIVRLSRKLDVIPADLNEYFQRMMNSIPSNHRREASMILQIALYEETDFGTLHPLYLMDLSFTDETQAAFAIENTYDFSKLDLNDSEEVQYRLASTARRLNSRCMGLVECRYEVFNQGFDLWDDFHQEKSQFELASFAMRKNAQMELLETMDHQSAFGGSNIHRAFCFYVEFLHRSCRDFLLSPESQKLLHHYTGGRFDARTFVRSARLVEIKALGVKGPAGMFAASLASYVLSTISLPEFRALDSSATVAGLLQPFIESIVQHNEFDIVAWYISTSLNTWHVEKSSFLTLAIDFQLTSYIRAHLTRSAIEKKKGRPILDYVLRPRFMGRTSDLGIGNVWPDMEILQSVLSQGGDPNQPHNHSTVWTQFLFFVMEWSNLIQTESNLGRVRMRDAYFTALSLLIANGAASHLPSPRLLDLVRNRVQGHVEHASHALDGSEVVGYWNTWIEPVSDKLIWSRLITMLESSNVDEYPVHDILELFRPVFGDGTDTLRAQLLSRA